MVFSATASANAREIAAFGTDRFGAAIGRTYVLGLRTACKRLGEFPALGRRHSTMDPPTRVLVYRSHRVFYRVEPDRILVLRIFHHAQATPPSL